MNTPVLVIAGHYREFLEWCRENDKNPADRSTVRYVFAQDQLYGWTRGVTLIFYGTYLNRPDWEKIHERALDLV